MKKVNKAPCLNEVNTPINETPDIKTVAYIKAVYEGKKYPVAELSYELFWNEEFQYCFTPFWEIIDELPPEAFLGIPGIDMDCRYDKYYRANVVPSFIIMRTPPVSRRDVMRLMKEVGSNHYDAFEWLIRTDYRASQDNLIVERDLE